MGVMAKELGYHYEKVDVERDELKERLEQIEQEKKKLEEIIQTSFMEAEETGKTRELTFQEELKTKEEFSNNVFKLQQEVMKQHLEKNPQNSRKLFNHNQKQRFKKEPMPLFEKKNNFIQSMLNGKKHGENGRKENQFQVFQWERKARYWFRFFAVCLLRV